MAKRRNQGDLARLRGQLGNQPFPQSAMPVPESEISKRWTQAVTLLALLLSVAYLSWRALETVNLAVWWISIPLLLLEAYAVGGLALFSTSLWDLDWQVPTTKRSRTYFRVAVLIPTYNEPEQILLPTIAAAVSMRLRHETWVLDDGDRLEVARLAGRLGAHYLTRPSHENAKAGNINYALSHIDADLVVLLDADHVASADFLSNTIGYFDDPRVALVQTPQDFYNLESFEHADEFNEQRLFYRVVLAGRNRWNAAFCCGTGSVLRVRSLEEVGGMAVETLTEDIHTTIRLHRRGWKTVYHNEALSHGLAAGDATQYSDQRLRWGTGAMQVLRTENPAFVSGLTLMQRTSYMVTLLGWFDSWRSLAFLLAPMVVLWTAAVPIRAPLTAFLPIFGITFLVQRYALRRLTRGTSPQLIGTVFEVVRMPANLRATLRLLAPGRPSFRVTPKGRVGELRSRRPVPGLLWVLLAASALTVPWTIASLLGLTPLRYSVPWLAYGSLFWLLVNGGLLLTAVGRIRAKRFGAERRAAVRFEVNAPARLGEDPVQLLDASLTGVRALVPASASAPEPGQVATIEITIDDRTYSFAGVIRSASPLSQRQPSPPLVVGLEFAQGQTAERAALALALFQTGVAPLIEPEALEDDDLVWPSPTTGGGRLSEEPVPAGAR